MNRQSSQPRPCSRSRSHRPYSHSDLLKKRKNLRDQDRVNERRVKVRQERPLERHSTAKDKKADPGEDGCEHCVVAEEGDGGETEEDEEEEAEVGPV